MLDTIQIDTDSDARDTLPRPCVVPGPSPHHDRVEEEHRVERIQGPMLPLRELVSSSRDSRDSNSTHPNQTATHTSAPTEHRNTTGNQNALQEEFGSVRLMV